MAPPLNDNFIVPAVPGYLYALFDYGLTVFQGFYIFFTQYLNQKFIMVIILTK